MTKLQDPSWDAFHTHVESCERCQHNQQNRKLRDACKVAQMALLGFIPKERNEVVSNALRVLEAVITPAWGAVGFHARGQYDDGKGPFWYCSPFAKGDGAKACWFETEAQAIAKAGGV